MFAKILAKRYAQAVLSLAEKEKILDQVEKELTGFLKLYQEFPGLGGILNHPLISQTEKKRFLNKVIGQITSPLLRRVIEVLISKGRTRYLPEIVEAYHNLADIRHGIARVKVRSYYPLAQDQLNILERKLRSRLAGTKQIVFQNTLDRSLLGGLVIQIGDDVIDGSVTGHLKKMQERLMYRVSN